jgi:glutamine synthetase adenylyltransferase
MDEEAINRARLRAQVWRENRHLFNCNEGVGELRRLSEEELEERDEAVALQMEGLAPSLNYATRIAAYRAELMRREVVLQRERMEELTANLVVQIEQMETLNDNLNRLLRIVIFSIVVCVLVRRVRP